MHALRKTTLRRASFRRRREVVEPGAVNAGDRLLHLVIGDTGLDTEVGAPHHGGAAVVAVPDLERRDVARDGQR